MLMTVLPTGYMLELGLYWISLPVFRIWLGLATAIQPEPELDLDLFSDYTAIHRMNLLASLLLSAAVEKQYSSVFL